MPRLLGKDEVTADALLKAAGLKTGTVTYDYDAGKPEGTVLTQSALPGTVLEPSSTVDYVINKMEEEGSTQAQAEENHYYIGSIDTTCSLSNYIGPASQTSSVKISIRLKQKDASGAEVYTPSDQSETGGRFPGYSHCIPKDPWGIWCRKWYCRSGRCREGCSDRLLSGLFLPGRLG